MILTSFLHLNVRQFIRILGEIVAMAKSRSNSTPIEQQRRRTANGKSRPVVITAGTTGVAWLGTAGLKERTPRTALENIQLAKQGIRKRSLDELAANIGLSKKNLAENIFDISIKTLERKAPNTKLDKKISSHALEIDRVLQHATEIFQDKEKVRQWIHRENKALHGLKPLDLFDTLTGLNLVNDILGRIEEGVYS